MKVADLKKALAEAGLATTGNKTELVARYEEYLTQKETEEEPKDETPPPMAETEPVVETAQTTVAGDADSIRNKIEAPKDKLDARAKRFGISKVTAPVAQTAAKDSKGMSAEELARMKRRVERFGAVDNSKGGRTVMASVAKEQKAALEKKKAERAARFAKVGETVDQKLKREARAKRFAQTA